MKTHDTAPILPGGLLGVLGGGQLGAMFAAAARRMGYRVAVITDTYVTMEGFKCNSRAIEAAEYEVNNKRLTVFFKNGSIYNYSDVPLRVYNDFRSSTSKGSFLNNVLKGFNFNKITV